VSFHRHFCFSEKSNSESLKRSRHWLRFSPTRARRRRPRDPTLAPRRVQCIINNEVEDADKITTSALYQILVHDICDTGGTIEIAGTDPSRDSTGASPLDTFLIYGGGAGGTGYEILEMKRMVVEVRTASPYVQARAHACAHNAAVQRTHAHTHALSRAHTRAHKHMYTSVGCEILEMKRMVMEVSVTVHTQTHACNRINSLSRASSCNHETNKSTSTPAHCFVTTRQMAGDGDGVIRAAPSTRLRP
jgi:hypothetical protein